MAKIGIITYHFARNYGAVLQCYALQRCLTSVGCEVEVLDYETVQQERNNSLHHKRDNLLKNAVMNIALLPFERQRRIKERKFADFERGELPLSPRLRDSDELERYVNSASFDVLISGSDQVLNPKIKDFDEGFLLPFETRAVKASFAASLGSATAGDLAPYKDELRGFDTLCVRERSDQAVVAELFGSEPILADDPVFLLCDRDWNEVIQRGNHMCGPSKGYVLGYFLNKEASSAYIKLSRFVAASLGLPLVILNVRFGLASFEREMVTDAGPLDFLSLLSGASFVCTDSFHGTAFSLIYGKPFVSFEPSMESSDWRKRDLLAKVEEASRSVAIDDPYIETEVSRVSRMPAPKAAVALKTIRGNQMAFLDELIAGRE